jgi:hypothetical protein
LRFENLKLLEESRQSEEWLVEAQKTAHLGYYLLDVPTGSWTSSKILDDVFGIGEDYRKDLEGWSLLVHPEERQSMLETSSTRPGKGNRSTASTGPSDGRSMRTVGPRVGQWSMIPAANP